MKSEFDEFMELFTQNEQVGFSYGNLTDCFMDCLRHKERKGKPWSFSPTGNMDDRIYFETKEEMLNAPLFDGKSFIEVFDQITIDFY